MDMIACPFRVKACFNDLSLQCLWTLYAI